jgi:hypothetical protein
VSAVSTGEPLGSATVEAHVAAGTIAFLPDGSPNNIGRRRLPGQAHLRQ